MSVTDLAVMPGRLTEVMTLRQATTASNRFLLLDVSGSMGELADAEARKIDRLREVVYGIRAEGVAFKQITFGASVELREDIPEPAGRTPLTEAIALARENHAAEIVVVSDGMPDNADTALHAAKGIKVSTFYVGPSPSAGEAFMKMLAEQTGGQSSTADLGKDIKRLKGEVKRALLALPPAIAL